MQVIGFVFEGRQRRTGFGDIVGFVDLEFGRKHELAYGRTEIDKTDAFIGMVIEAQQLPSDRLGSAGEHHKTRSRGLNRTNRKPVSLHHLLPSLVRTQMT